MEKIIEFKNTSFAYNNTNAFNDFNMEIEKGDIVSLIGPTGSGKTILLKMLCHRLPNDSVYYNGAPINSYDVKELQQKIIVVFDSLITSKTVNEELIKYLKMLKYSQEEITKRFNDFTKIFNLNRFNNIEIKKLNNKDAYLIKILRYLIIEPEFIAIDGILTNVSQEDKIKIFEFVKSKGMTMLNITTDLEDSLFGNKIFVLENFVLILEGSTLSVLKTDTLLKRLGYKLPLAVDLSIELGHYDVLKKVFMGDEKLVNELWK